MKNIIYTDIVCFIITIKTKMNIIIPSSDIYMVIKM